MRAVVDGQISFQAGDAPARLIERLRRELSFPNPDYVSRLRMGRYVGATPERIECLEASGGRVCLPRGAVGLLRDRARDAGVDLAFEDCRVTLPALEDIHDVSLRPYQQKALSAICSGVQGTVLMPCGGGKTVVGLGAISAIRQPTLVIVHTHDLLDQWREQLAIFLGVVAGAVTEGQVDLAPITVATVQTLVRMDGEKLEDLGQKFGCVIVDEAHHVPASTFRTVLAHLPARYRFGLTATPERDDGLTRLLDLCVGPRLFEIGQADLVRLGHLMRPEVRPLYSSFSFNYEGSQDHERCMRALIADKERNRLIVDRVVDDARAGCLVLVLSGRVEHCRRLDRLIRDRGVRVKLLTGAVDRSDRREILDAFRRGLVPVVVASTVADEGLDVPRLDRIVLAYPGRAKGRTTQRLGRLMRPHSGKKPPVLYDVVDPLVPALLSQFAERRRLYTRLTGRKVGESPNGSRFELAMPGHRSVTVQGG